jgi:hypothetical protein
MSKQPENRPTYTVELRPGPHVTEPIRMLRLALKRLLREYGFRCTSILEK